VTVEDERRSRAPGNPYLGVPGFDDARTLELGALFGADGDWELEIGFGKGRFLLDRAEANPGVVILGIETRRKGVHLVAGRAAGRAIDNVRLRFGDAREAIRRMHPGGCLCRVFINFPDPWWKARHAKRMVVSGGLGRELRRLLRPSGEIFIQTDVDFRADEFESELGQVEGLSGGRIEVNPFGARSLREVRCEELGLPIHRLLFRRD